MTAAAEQHDACVRRLARAIAEALPGSWRVSVPGGIDRVAYLTRSDDLALSLYWDRPGSRADMRPRVPEIPGYSRDRPGLEATFDPKRAPSSIASQVQRMVVTPWEPLLAEITQRHARILSDRAEAHARLEQLGKVLHTGEAELTRALEHTDKGEGDGTLYLGKYDHPSMYGTLAVSTYKQRVKLELDIYEPRLALVIARVLAAELARANTSAV